MPKMVSEISQGMNYEFSADQGGLAASAVRVFRIIKLSPEEYIDVPVVCQAPIGTEHPRNQGLWCVAFSAVYEGESRLVLLATFNYRSTPSADSSGNQGQDPKSFQPDLRPANWSTSTNLIEVPAYTWTEVGASDIPLNGGAGVPCTNPVGDRYEGVTRFESIVTITVEHFSTLDPTRFVLYAGFVNQDVFKIGSLNCFRGSVMYRGVQSRPTIESWGGRLYRGWTATHELAFRRNFVKGIYVGGTVQDLAIGWDMAVPQTGFNVKSLLGSADVEKAGMPLRHKSGRIEDWPNGVSLPKDVVNGQKARGMVLVQEYEDGGASQLPCAQPIPLNNDGSPRIDTADPKVIVRRYRTNPEIEFLKTFDWRLTQ